MCLWKTPFTISKQFSSRRKKNTKIIGDWDNCWSVSLFFVRVRQEFARRKVRKRKRVSDMKVVASVAVLLCAMVASTFASTCYQLGVKSGPCSEMSNSPRLTAPNGSPGTHGNPGARGPPGIKVGHASLIRNSWTSSSEWKMIQQS